MDEQTKLARFKQLTWPHLADWAGDAVAERGRQYHLGGRVRELARTPDGAVVAWVQGTRRYATLVDIAEYGLLAACTCPYGGTCKHAVALALAYLDALKAQRDLPTATERDLRLAELDAVADDLSDEEDWEEGEDGEDEDSDDEADAEAAADGAADQPPATVRAFLDGLTQAQLVDLLVELAHRYPDVQSALEARRTLAGGSAAPLVREIRGLIARTAAQTGWRNEWDGEGYTPDYSRVRDRLALLLRRGYADEVLDLGETLLEAGTAQVEESHDEGETGAEIAECLTVVFRALARSSLSPSEQILWLIDAQLKDEYDLCAGADVFWEEPKAPADWSAVADALAERLAETPASPDQGDFTRSYRRDRLTNWLIRALQAAGRAAEIIPLAEREAVANGSYDRLVKLLIEAGRPAEAERWAVKGMAALEKGAPGIAAGLRATVRDLAERAGDWPRVAAIQADDFFREPSTHALQRLQAAAERAGVWPAVRAAALRYLETGEPPAPVERVVGGARIPAWPLPDSGVPRPAHRWQPSFPVFTVLVDLAVMEQRPDDVLRWYDQSRAGARAWGGVNDAVVADAVADAHPARALAIWKRLAEGQIAQTQPAAYEVAAGYLRQMKRVLDKQGQADEWRRYVADLREANRRKRRLVEILDRLTGPRP